MCIRCNDASFVSLWKARSARCRHGDNVDSRTSEPTNGNLSVVENAVPIMFTALQDFGECFPTMLLVGIGEQVGIFEDLEPGVDDFCYIDACLPRGSGVEVHFQALVDIFGWNSDEKEVSFFRRTCEEDVWDAESDNVLE